MTWFMADVQVMGVGNEVTMTFPRGPKAAVEIGRPQSHSAAKLECFVCPSISVLLFWPSGGLAPVYIPTRFDTLPGRQARASAS